MRSYLDWYYRRDYQNAYKIITPISCFFHSILPFYGSMILRLYRILSPTKLAIFPLSLYALNNRCSLVRKWTTRTQWTMKTWETSDSWSSLQSFGLAAGGMKSQQCRPTSETRSNSESHCTWAAGRKNLSGQEGREWLVYQSTPSWIPVDWTNVRGVGLVRHWTALDLRVAATAGRLKLPPTYSSTLAVLLVPRGLKAVVPTSWVNDI